MGEEGCLVLASKGSRREEDRFCRLSMLEAEASETILWLFGLPFVSFSWDVAISVDCSGMPGDIGDGKDILLGTRVLFI